MAVDIIIAFEFASTPTSTEIPGIKKLLIILLPAVSRSHLPQLYAAEALQSGWWQPGNSLILPLPTPSLQGRSDRKVGEEFSSSCPHSSVGRSYFLAQLQSISSSLCCGKAIPNQPSRVYLCGIPLSTDGQWIAGQQHQFLFSQLQILLCGKKPVGTHSKR